MADDKKKRRLRVIRGGKRKRKPPGSFEKAKKDESAKDIRKLEFQNRQEILRMRLKHRKEMAILKKQKARTKQDIYDLKRNDRAVRKSYKDNTTTKKQKARLAELWKNEFDHETARIKHNQSEYKRVKKFWKERIKYLDSLDKPVKVNYGGGSVKKRLIKAAIGAGAAALGYKAIKNNEEKKKNKYGEGPSERRKRALGR